jgi:histidinol-phosphate transaminase
LPKHGRLIVVRTLSKAFALAGGRVGYAVAAPAVVDALRVIRLPYHLSTTTQAVARVALSHAPQMLDKVAELRITRDETATWLARHGLDVVPSQANFVLFGRFADRHRVFTTLLERGVLVREVGPEGYLRVSAGTPEQMSEFRAAMIEVISTSPRLPAGPSDAGHGDPGPRTTDPATRDPSPVPGGHDD